MGSLFSCMKYIQVTIQSNEYQQEELISFLNDLDPTGFEQHPQELVAYFSFDGYAPDEVEALLHGYTFRTEIMEDQNWNQVWESNFDPVVVDDFCAIRADFHPPASGVEHEIIITPKMSFGTGHHATTYMMVRQMKSIDFKNKRVFDFGTGTGILAILAEKLGAGSVSAIDVDDWSIENAQENFKRNGCQKISIKKTGALPVEGSFDVILANINRNVILDSMEQLSRISASGGLILFSGLLVTDEADIVNAATSLAFLRKEEKNNWVSLLFINRR
jgi:ribosomal protein L11 methyltransferase